MGFIAVFWVNASSRMVLSFLNDIVFMIHVLRRNDLNRSNGSRPSEHTRHRPALYPHYWYSTCHNFNSACPGEHRGRLFISQLPSNHPANFDSHMFVPQLKHHDRVGGVIVSISWCPRMEMPQKLNRVDITLYHVPEVPEKEQWKLYLERLRRPRRTIRQISTVTQFKRFHPGFYKDCITILWCMMHKQ